jgi:peptidoglycan/LPS O-acetylase OafA/YrhL
MSAGHLRFLDGIRALSALYVVSFHMMSVVPQDGLPGWFRKFESLFWQGHLAVGVFIVLSGFVLMLPVVRSADGQLRGGLREYFRRRGMRILIPYYAALFLAIPPDLYRQHTHHEIFSWSSLIAHLFVVHDFRLEWMQGFDGPLWSVAVEWHIYFLFALLLLPIWRRFGIAASTLFAFALGLIPPFFFPHVICFDWASPWFVGLFGLGNLAAYLAYTPKPGVSAQAARLPWGLMALICFGCLQVSLLYPLKYSSVLNDILTGCTFFCFILYCVGVLRRTSSAPDAAGSWSWQRRVIEWLGGPRLTALAGFSYSIYLIHFPLLSTLDTVLKTRIHSDKALMVIQLLVVYPTCLGAAYLFSLVFERPFMRARPRPTTPNV